MSLAETPDGPIGEIREERERARREGDPLADVCFLATSAPGEGPQCRPLTLRQIAGAGFGLLLNRLSPKWRQIEAGGPPLLLLYWPSIHRQYRVRGELRPMDASDREAQWSLKARSSRLLEHYYGACRPQSSEVPSREAFLEEMEALGRRFPEGGAIPAPGTLEGVWLRPARIETWHGSPHDRLHHRRLHTRDGAVWHSRALVP